MLIFTFSLYLRYNKVEVKIMLGLYVHIPFCNNICYYCDFTKKIAKQKEKEKYINYLIKEIKLYQKYFADIETVYIGGGTPSSLNLSLLEKLLIVLPKKIKEFTIECNPEDINQEFLALLVKYNVNRISLGVQTFNNKLLKTINRKHTYQTTVKSVELIKKYQLNLNIDLIFGIPKQNLANIQFDLKTATALDVNHISYYCLILENKTVFSKMYKENKIELLEEELEASFYELIINFLKENGYLHYEISNFSKSGYQSIHNIKYWQNQEYIGVGNNASGYLNNKRYINKKLFADYYQSLDQDQLPIAEINKVSKKDSMYEYVMLGFRMLQIDMLDFEKRYQIDIFEAFTNLNELITDNFIEKEKNFLKLTNKGLLLNNELLIKLME